MLKHLVRDALGIGRSASVELIAPFPVGQVALTTTAVVLSSKGVFHLLEPSTHVTVTHECGTVIIYFRARAFVALHTLVNYGAIPTECMA